MKRSVIIGGSLLGITLFVSGYLIGRSGTGGTSGDLAEISGVEESRPRRDSTGDPSRARADSRRISRATAAYQRVTEMMSQGDLSVGGVSIDSESMRPGDKVQEFFALSDEEMEVLKEICRVRLRAREDRMAELAVVHSCSESGIEFDLPADPEFADSEVASLVEKLKNTFGEEIGGALSPSVGHAYGGLASPSKVIYRLSAVESSMEISEYPEAMREKMASQRTVKTFINWDEETNQPLADENGLINSHSYSSTASIYLNDESEDVYRPRYHFLWERENGRR